MTEAEKERAAIVGLALNRAADYRKRAIVPASYWNAEAHALEQLADAIERGDHLKGE